jgi:DNA-binding transcriptional MocR family regulator
MTGAGSADLDRAVYERLLQGSLESGRVPQAEDLSESLSVSREEVEAALGRLAAGRVIVLSPARHSTHVWMANPFSAVPTMFRVMSAGRSYWGNCVWDALGVVALAGGSGRVDTACGDCGEPMALEVRDGELVAGEGIVHFAVPAARWWDNIGFT